MKTKSIDNLNIEAIFKIEDRDYKYIGIRKTHQGGYLSGTLFDDIDDLAEEIGCEDLSDVYTKEELVDFLQQLIEAEDDEQDWQKILDNVYACEEWTNDKVVSSWESVIDGNPCGALEDKFDVYTRIWGNNYQYFAVYDTETVIKSIALDAVDEATEIPYVGNFIDYANSQRGTRTEIDGDDYVRVVIEHIDDHLTWEENNEEILFFCSEIDDDKKLYVINPKFGQKAVQAILALRDNTSFEPINQDYAETDGNIIYIESDAFWDWDNDFTLDDVERLIEKIAEE